MSRPPPPTQVLDLLAKVWGAQWLYIVSLQIGRPSLFPLAAGYFEKKRIDKKKKY